MELYRRLCVALLFAGLALLPFSVGEYGIGVLAVLCSMAALGVAFYLPRLGRYARYLFAALLHCVSAVTAILLSPTSIATLPRLAAHLIGFAIFTYLLSPLFSDTSFCRNGRALAVSTFILVATATTLGIYYLSNFGVQVGEINFNYVASSRVIGGAAGLEWAASNVIASVLIFPFFISLYCWQTSTNPRYRLFYLMCCSFLGGAILMTFSRGAMIVTVLGGLGITWLESKKTFFKLAVVAALAAGVIVVASNTSFYQEADDVLFQRFRSQDMVDLNNRVQFWQDYTELISDSPIWGSGYLVGVETFGYSAHNLILSLLADRGLIGFLSSAILVVLAVFYVLRSLSRAAPPLVRRFYRYAAVGGAAALTHLMIEDAHYTVQYIIFSWFYLAMIFLGRTSLMEQLAAVQKLAPGIAKNPISSQPAGYGPRRSPKAIPCSES